MKWCGLPRNWSNLSSVYPYLTTLNKKLTIPLPLREVEGIAKSVVNISSHNLASGQTQAKFSQIQAARGRKGGRISGAKRYQGSNEQAQPWVAEGVSRAAWYYKQAGKHTGRPGRQQQRESIEQRQPWVAEGVSRRAWYYKQAGKHTGQQARKKKLHCKVRLEA